jgi:TolA-binding protein
VLYDILIEDFANSPRSARALFQKAFMLDQMDQNEDAATYYKRFLETYPENKLVPQVKILLEEVNLSDEELLNRLGNKKEG